MAYVALKRLRVGEDQFREYGEYVPEADDWTWQIRQTYLSNGIIEKVPEPRVFSPEAREAALAEAQAKVTPAKVARKGT